MTGSDDREFPEVAGRSHRRHRAQCPGCLGRVDLHTQPKGCICGTTSGLWRGQRPLCRCPRDDALALCIVHSRPRVISTANSPGAPVSVGTTHCRRGFANRRGSCRQCAVPTLRPLLKRGYLDSVCPARVRGDRCRDAAGRSTPLTCSPPKAVPDFRLAAIRIMAGVLDKRGIVLLT